MLFDLHNPYEPREYRLNILFSDYGDEGSSSYTGGGYSDPGYGDGGNYTGEPGPGETGGDSEPIEQEPILDEEAYQKWKEKYKGKYTVEEVGNEYTQEQLDLFKEERYAEWRSGAWENEFTDNEIAEFHQRDATEGISQERTEQDLARKTAEAPYVKYDEETGRPIGLYYKDYYTGEEKLIKSYDKMNELLDQIESTEFPTFQAWLDSQGLTKNDLTESNAYEQLEAIAEELSSGVFSEDVLNEAMANVSRILGLEDYSATTGAMQQELAEGIGAQEGLSAEEEENIRGANRETFRQQELMSTRALEAIRANGQSTAKYLQMADEYASQITSSKIQAELAIATEDYDRKTAEWNALNEQYQYLVTTGLATQTEYLNAYQENRATALQAYAAQINVLVEENNELFQQYSADQQALAANLQNMYAALNAEMGFDQWALSDQEQQYATTVYPILVQLDYMTQQQYLELAEEAQEAQEKANMMKFVGGIISTIGGIFG